MNPLNVFFAGKQYDWGNITLLMFNGMLSMVNNIKFDESRDSVNNYGIGQLPTGYGNKNFVFDASITIQIDELNQIQKVSPSGKILLIPPFTTKMILSGDGVAYTTYKLLNCRFTKNPFDSKQNDSSIFVTTPIIFAGLIQS